MMFNAKHRQPAVYKIHYNIYLRTFLNNFIRSRYINFPFPNNRKGISSSLKHLYQLWAPTSLPCNGELGAIFLGIRKLQHEVPQSPPCCAGQEWVELCLHAEHKQLHLSLSIRTTYPQHLDALHHSTVLHIVIQSVLPICLVTSLLLTRLFRLSHFFIFFWFYFVSLYIWLYVLYSSV